MSLEQPTAPTVATRVAGGLDPSFDVAKKLKYTPGDAFPAPASADQTGGQKFYVVGFTSQLYPNTPTWIARYDAAGVADESFNGGEQLTIAPFLQDNDSSYANFSVRTMVFDGQDGITCLGDAPGMFSSIYSNAPAACRINPAGTMDVTFGNKEDSSQNNGTALYLTGFKLGADAVIMNLFASVRAYSRPGESLLFLSKLCRMFNKDQLLSPYSYHLTKILGDGKPDKAFGNNGILQIDPASVGGKWHDYGVDDRGSLTLVGEAIEGGQPRAVVVRYTADGQLDEGFGIGGREVINEEIEDLVLRQINVSKDGAISLLVNFQESGRVKVGLMKRFKDGAADLTFHGGKPLEVDAGSVVRVHKMLVDDEGRFIFARSSTPPAITRLTPAGAPDSSFGSNGTVEYPDLLSVRLVTVLDKVDLLALAVGPPSKDPVYVRIFGSNDSGANMPAVAHSAGGRDRTFNRNDAYIDDASRSFAVDPNMGSTQKFYMTNTPTAHQTPSELLRYNADGTMDTSFPRVKLPTLNLGMFGKLDPHGLIFSQNKDGVDTITCVGVAKALIGEPNKEHWYFYPAAIRVTALGEVDSSFGDQGAKVYQFVKEPDGNLLPHQDMLSRAFTSYRGTRQASGEIIFCCCLTNLILDNDSIVLVRMDADGKPVEGFGENGVRIITTLTEANPPTWNDYGIDKLGKVTLVGTTSSTAPTAKGLLLRFDAKGEPDESYGPEGKKTIQVNGLRTSIWSVTFSDNGKTTLLVAVGEASVRRFAVVRFRDSGEYDPGFSVDEPFWIDGVTNAHLAVDSKDRVIVSGKIPANALARVFRILPTGTLDPEFDGDGEGVNPGNGNGVVEPSKLISFKRLVVQNGTDLLAHSHDFNSTDPNGQHMVRLWGEPGDAKNVSDV